MSVDVLISPRISFSHNIIQTEHGSSVPIETYPYVDTGFDFDFAFIVDSEGSLIREPSTADELFSNGKLLPISSCSAPNREIQIADSPSPNSPCLETEEDTKQEKKRTIKSLKEHLEDGIDIEEGLVGKSQTSVIRTFWKFSRSNSFNGSGNYGRNRAKFSIPSKLRLLSRSKSTKPLEETQPTPASENPPEVLAGRMLWKARRSCSLNCENRGGLIGSLKMILGNSTEEVNARQLRMRRSCSLNCDDGNNRGGSGSSSIRVLGRSKSAGSGLKQIGIKSGKKEGEEQNSARGEGWKKGKGKGRKSVRNYNGYISRASVDLLGFGSLFCTSKFTNKTK